VFNVCTGQETRLLDLLEVLFDLFPNVQEPVFAEERAGDIYRSVGSSDFTTQELGFQAEVTLEHGLKETVAWMKA